MSWARNSIMKPRLVTGIAMVACIISAFCARAGEGATASGSEAARARIGSRRNFTGVLQRSIVVRALVTAPSTVYNRANHNGHTRPAPCAERLCHDDY